MRVRSAKFVAAITSQGVERYLEALQESLNDHGADASIGESTTGAPCVMWEFPDAKNAIRYSFSVGSVGAWLEISENSHHRLLDKEILSQRQLIRLIGQSRSAAFITRRRGSRLYKNQFS